MYQNNSNISVSQKAFQYHKQIARQQRQQIISKHRQQLYKYKTQFHLQSDTLQKYSQIPQNKLYQYRDEIFDTLDEINGQQLTEDQSVQLCRDLLHLQMQDHQFLLPYTMKFLKDTSQLTATVVAFSYECLDMQQGNYWLRYMNDESKSAIYLSLQCEEDITRWIGDSLLLDSLVDDWGHLQEAQSAISFLLGEIAIGKEQQFIQNIFDKLHQMNKRSQLKLTSTLFLILVRLMIHYQQQKTQIFSYISIILNESIHKLYTQNQKSSFDYKFLFDVQILMNRNKQYCQVIFNQVNFEYMLQIIVNCYRERFKNQQSFHINKQIMSQEKFNKIQSNYILSLIDICMNHLRIHRLFKNFFSISNNLINAFKPSQSGKVQQKYQKLVQFNNIHPQSNQSKTQQNNITTQSPFKGSFQDIQI